MKQRSKEFYYIDRHRFGDARLHEPILADGDEAAARRVSDAVARRLGLTENEIAALRRSDYSP